MTALAAPADAISARPTRRTYIEASAGIGFAAPAFILLLTTILAPLAVLAVLSFTNYELGALDLTF
ncbi:MAG: multiple sugar transport system permease protein, partial [Hyphomicrobiales bacterium]